MNMYVDIHINDKIVNIFYKDKAYRIEPQYLSSVIEVLISIIVKEKIKNLYLDCGYHFYITMELKQKVKYLSCDVKEDSFKELRNTNDLKSFEDYCKKRENLKKITLGIKEL